MTNHSYIEALESRIAPAGVSALVKSGTLFVQSDQATVLLIDHIDTGEWYITDDATVLGPFDGVRALDVRLTGPSSTVTYVHSSAFTGKSKFSLTDGPDTLRVRKGNFPNVVMGSLEVDARGGDDVLDIASRILDADLQIGAVSLRGGGGADSLALGQSMVFVVPSLTYSAIESANVAALISGNVTIDNRMSQVPTLTGISRVDGSFSYKGGPEIDDVTLIGGVGGRGAKLDLGEDDNRLVIGVGSYAGLSMKGGIGDDVLDIKGATFSGAVSLKLGNGDNMFNFENSTLETISVKGGLLADDLGIILGCTVNGDCSLKLGGAPNRINLESSNFIKAVTIKGGSARDDLYMVGINVSGLLSIHGGEGDNYFFFSDGNAMLKGMTLRGGAGADRIEFTEGTTVIGNMVAILGNGLNDMRMTDVNPRLEITGGFTYAGGAGPDTLAGLGLSFAVGAAVKVTLGDGENTFEMGGDIDGRSIAITGGRGQDTIYVDCVADLTKLGISAGAGDDTVQIFGSYQSGVLNGGSGTDTLLGMPPAVLRRVSFEAGII
jgi:hypothetical protein